MKNCRINSGPWIDGHGCWYRGCNHSPSHPVDPHYWGEGWEAKGSWISAQEIGQQWFRVHICTFLSWSKIIFEAHVDMCFLCHCHSIAILHTWGGGQGWIKIRLSVFFRTDSLRTQTDYRHLQEFVLVMDSVGPNRCGKYVLKSFRILGQSTWKLWWRGNKSTHTHT